MNPSLPTLSSLVKGPTFVRFTHYRNGELWYEVLRTREPLPGGEHLFTISDPVGFSFPVPITDCGDATFLVEDKALLFMRYIRKHLADLQSELDLAEAARKEHETTRRPPHAGGSGGNAAHEIALVAQAVESKRHMMARQAEGYKS